MLTVLNQDVFNQIKNILQYQLIDQKQALHQLPLAQITKIDLNNAGIKEHELIEVFAALYHSHVRNLPIREVDLSYNDITS